MKKLWTRLLTLFKMGFFGAPHGWGGQKRPPLPKICCTYPTMMKLGTVIPYRKKIQKIYDSRDTLLEFCWQQHFFTGNQQILLYQEIQIQIPFRYIISNSSNFSWVFKDCFNNVVKILMISAKMATPGLLKIKILWKKVMTSWLLSMTSPTKFYHVIQITM